MSLSVMMAFGAMVCWGVGDFLIQKVGKILGAVGTIFWITLFSSFALLPFVIHDLPALTWENIGVLSILGVIGFFGAFLHIRALKIGKLSVVEIIISIELPLTIMLGIIFFAESLNLTQIILICLLFIGVIMVSINFKNVRRKDFFEKGSLLALLAAVMIAMMNFLTAFQAKEINPLLALWFPWLVSGLITCAYLAKRRHIGVLVKACRSHWQLIAAMVVIDTAAWVFYVLAVSKAELSITVAITESFVVIAFFLDIIFNKVKVSKIQYVGAGLAIACSLLIGLLSK